MFLSQSLFVHKTKLSVISCLPLLLSFHILKRRNYNWKGPYPLYVAIWKHVFDPLMFKDVPAGSHRVIFYCKAPAIDTPDPLYDLLTTGITQQPIMAFFVRDLYFSVDHREDLYWTEAWLRAFIVTRIGMITSAHVYLYLYSVYSIFFIVYWYLYPSAAWFIAFTVAIIGSQQHQLQ